MDLSLLPKVDKIILTLADDGPGREDRSVLLLTESAQEAVASLRARLLAQGDNGPEYTKESLLKEAITETLRLYAEKNTPYLRPVINATGIPLHTNLGRAPLAAEAVENVAACAKGYCNLELSLETGKRGSRYNHVTSLLSEVTGAEDALVVNNNAAAVLLVLDTFAKGCEAIVSRGQLVEIGDSFRIPDVMAKSGATLVEVGATNKTRLSDYERAITENTRMIMQVHPSNFKIMGFHESVPTAELVALGRKHHIPVMDDLGAGCVYPLAAEGIGEEPLVAKVLADGADIVTCSGDKLLGGPQAGIILGRREYIEQLKRNPLNRALRIDKFTLAALEATLRIYRKGEAKTKIPVISMITADPQALHRKAEQLAYILNSTDLDEALYNLSLVPAFSEAGGGSLPTVQLPTTVVQLTPQKISTQKFLDNLRRGKPALLAYIHEDKLMIDPRTMSGHDLELAAALIRKAAADTDE